MKRGGQKHRQQKPKIGQKTQKKKKKKKAPETQAGARPNAHKRF